MSGGKRKGRSRGALQHHHIRQLLSCYMVLYVSRQTDWVNGYTRADENRQYDDEGSHFQVSVRSTASKYYVILRGLSLLACPLVGL